MKIDPANVMRTFARQTWERALVVVSVGCAVAYLLEPILLPNLEVGFWLILAVIKGLAVASLALLVWHWLKGKDGTLLTVALALSSLGDVFLALPYGDAFVYGLLSFLIAHLFFLALWRRNWPTPLRLTNPQRVTMVILAVYVLGMMAWILPVPGLSLAVAAYMIVLTVMVMAAVLVRVNPVWIGGGAILFLISDSLIALGRFKQVGGEPWTGFLIWSTYYLAQYLMTFGFVLGKMQLEDEGGGLRLRPADPLG
jgi:uncharacterized membrane protein YhhN